MSQEDSAAEPAGQEPAEGQEPTSSNQEQGREGQEPTTITLDAEYVRKLRGEAAETRRKLKEIEDRDKSETEKVTERAAQAERRAQEAETRLLRLEVAAKKGLNADLASRLVGDSKEDLEKDADKLLAQVQPQQGGFDQGARRSGQPQSMDSLIRHAAGRG